MQETTTLQTTKKELFPKTPDIDYTDINKVMGLYDIIKRFVSKRVWIHRHINISYEAILHELIMKLIYKTSTNFKKENGNYLNWCTYNIISYQQVMKYSSDHSDTIFSDISNNDSNLTVFKEDFQYNGDDLVGELYNYINEHIDKFTAMEIYLYEKLYIDLIEPEELQNKIGKNKYYYNFNKLNKKIKGLVNDKYGDLYC